jgi:hypothetical protein
MVSAMNKRKNGGRPVLYNKNGKDKLDDPLVIAEDSPGYMTPCPVCEWRVFDVFNPPDKQTRIEIKCPNCRNVVDIPIYELRQQVIKTEYR